MHIGSVPALLRTTQDGWAGIHPGIHPARCSCESGVLRVAVAGILRMAHGCMKSPRRVDRAFHSIRLRFSRTWSVPCLPRATIAASSRRTQSSPLDYTKMTSACLLLCTRCTVPQSACNGPRLLKKLRIPLKLAATTRHDILQRVIPGPYTNKQPPYQPSLLLKRGCRHQALEQAHDDFATPLHRVLLLAVRRDFRLTDNLLHEIL